jgi:hypothetical protein
MGAAPSLADAQSFQQAVRAEIEDARPRSA